MNDSQNIHLTKLLVLLIAVLATSAAYYIYLQQTKITQLQSEFAAKESQLQSEFATKKGQLETELAAKETQLQTERAMNECKGIWKDGVCAQTSLIITSPKPGDSVCINDTKLKIAWTGAENLTSVNITFPVQGTYFPVVKEFVTKYPNQPVKNEYIWNLADFIAKNEKGKTGSWYTPITPNNNYKLLIQGTSPSGENVTATNEYFSLIKC